MYTAVVKTERQTIASNKEEISIVDKPILFFIFCYFLFFYNTLNKLYLSNSIH